MEEKDITTKVHEAADKVARTIMTGSKNVMSRLDAEKAKAEIRAEIGHNARDLSRAYEKLGRAYYSALTAGEDLQNEEGTLELIRSKEKIIELLNEKLDQMDA